MAREERFATDRTSARSSIHNVPHLVLFSVPFKREVAYCFEFSDYRSVCLSVCRLSVYLSIVLYTKYCPLNIFLCLSCQTWYSCCPWKDVPLFSHVAKDQGQNAGLCTNDVRSLYFDPVAWELPNLVQWLLLKNALGSYG